MELVNGNENFAPGHFSAVDRQYGRCPARTAPEPVSRKPCRFFLALVERGGFRGTAPLWLQKQRGNDNRGAGAAGAGTAARARLC